MGLVAALLVGVLSTAYPDHAPRRIHAMKLASPGAAGLVDEAIRRSPAIRALLKRLNSTDVVVYVRPAFDLRTRTAEVRFMGCGGGVRRLVISIDYRNIQNDRIALLAHELQHAVEVSEHQDVRDDAGMRRLYERIGWPTDNEHATFETDAAIRAGTQVRWEITDRRSSIGNRVARARHTRPAPASSGQGTRPLTSPNHLVKIR